MDYRVQPIRGNSRFHQSAETFPPERPAFQFLRENVGVRLIVVDVLYSPVGNIPRQLVVARTDTQAQFTLPLAGTNLVQQLFVASAAQPNSTVVGSQLTLTEQPAKHFNITILQWQVTKLGDSNAQA